MKWTKGRQKTGYLKKTFYAFKLLGVGFDCHLIKYPEGSHIPPHVDEVTDKSHGRLNIILNHAELGGQFKKNGVAQHGRIHMFRPDRDKHEVTNIDKGNRMVLSFGIAY
jgi:hypothetical protein